MEGRFMIETFNDVRNLHSPIQKNIPHINTDASILKIKVSPNPVGKMIQVGRVYQDTLIQKG